MRIVADNKYEALKLAAGVMPNNSQIEDLDGKWRIARTMDGVWTVYIAGAAKKAKKMGHERPHADTKWYEDGELAAEAVNHGHHTAYGNLEAVAEKVTLKRLMPEVEDN